jgi:hypothetical protein
MFCGLRFDNATGKVAGAEALITIYLVKQANGTEDSGGQIVDLVG